MKLKYFSKTGLTSALVVTATLLVIAQAALKGDKDWKKEETKNAKLPPCSACNALVKSFEAGLERTSRGKFEGGDTAWEEKNQGKGYAISEVRFVEIQERLCSDVDRGEAQCHDNHHNWEEHLEEWWNQGVDRPDLRQWLCVYKLQDCCPEEHYGSKCKPCSKMGANGKLCSGRGRCKGSGTRKGNGACQCNDGYSGELCDQCGIGYYDPSTDQTEDDKKSDSDKVETGDEPLCKKCHQSCKLCSGKGKAKCLACNDGYIMMPGSGCQDVDECVMGDKSKTCKRNEFCVNTDGSYQCHKCDKACKSCHGDGPDSCDACAEGYTRSEDNAVCMTVEAAEANATRKDDDEELSDPEDNSDADSSTKTSTLPEAGAESVKTEL